MRFLDLYDLYFAGNKKLIYFLLQSIIECIPERFRDKYYKQIDCINKIQWVLDVEADLYLDSSSICKGSLINEWEEKVLAEIFIKDKAGKNYKLKVYAVNGHVFSIEGNLPFKYVTIDDIADLDVKCGKD